MIKSSRRRSPFVQRDRDVVISDGDAAVKLELLFQTKCALEPFRALLRIAYRQAEVADHSKFKWNFHVRSLQERARNGKVESHSSRSEAGGIGTCGGFQTWPVPGSAIRLSPAGTEPVGAVPGRRSPVGVRSPRRPRSIEPILRTTIKLAN